MAEERLYGAAAVAGRGRRDRLGHETVMKQRSYIVEEAAGRAQWVFETVSQIIKDAQMPDVWCELSEVSTGMFGEKRDFLVVGHTKLRDYKMFVGARSYGIHLDVSWYMTVEPGLLKRTLSKYTQGNPQGTGSVSWECFCLLKSSLMPFGGRKLHARTAASLARPKPQQEPRGW